VAWNEGKAVAEQFSCEFYELSAKHDIEVMAGMRAY
jgi:hypothetical protein